MMFWGVALLLFMDLLSRDIPKECRLDHATFATDDTRIWYYVIRKLA
jgi:hypothetical protein